MQARVLHHEGKKNNEKLLKIMLIALCTILTVLVVFVASVYVVNLISNEREQGK